MKKLLVLDKQKSYTDDEDNIELKDVAFPYVSAFDFLDDVKVDSCINIVPTFARVNLKRPKFKVVK